MPITSDQMTYEEMKKVVSNPRYKCGECGGQLTLAWGGSLGYDGYIIKCGNDVNHSTITKYNRKEAEYMQEAKDQSAVLSSTALQAMTETAMVERVGKAKFVKDLTAREATMLAVACITYGFDPIMHELTIFQGNPFVSVDGRYRKAQETGQLDGMSCRPATKDEKVEWEIPEGDKFFRAECHRKDAKYPFVGWGRVTAKEMAKANEFTPIATNPQRMAEKRAEVQALRKAFHIPLPSAEYIGMVEVEGVGLVDQRTGLIKAEGDIEGESRVVEDEPESSETKAEEQAELPEPKPEKKLDLVGDLSNPDAPIQGTQLHHLSTITAKAGSNLKALMKWCKEDKGWTAETFNDLTVKQYKEIVKSYGKGT